jgi:hypothetical protein
MKRSILILPILAMGALLWADELDDAYAALKEAQSSNNADEILKWAPEVSKLGRAEAARSKPDNMSAEDWKARVEYAKQVDTLAEYALSAAAVQPGADPNKIVALVDALLAINPKSQYLVQSGGAYIAALEKASGTAKSLEGAGKILNGNPNNEDALFALANGNYGKNNDRAEQYATRLVNVMRSKAKPEGIAEADWDKKKSTMLGYGYYYAGIVAGSSQRPSFTDCDRNLRAGLPYITKQAGLAGSAYFYLGLCNYQISKLTQDKAKLQEALQFTDQAAAISGPMQGQAQSNAAIMRRELGVGAAKGAAPAKPAAKGK